jgi:ferric-dicitrate binding protein FerR (iron transport regulator)
MDSERITHLVDKWFSRSLSPAEEEEFLAWISRSSSSGELRVALQVAWEKYEPDEALKEQADPALERILGKLREKTRPEVKRIPIWRYGAAVAALLLLIGGGVYLLNNQYKEKPAIALHYKGDVQPGHNGAVLHLSNGSKVVLDSARNGTVATQGTIQAVKVNGELKYVGTASEVVYNTITTDRGRQWQLTLSDGTKVWLNAASSIHYPLVFTGSERVVEITGEAYLEVAHNPQKPFRVKVGDQVIEDVGTAFNVNAYGDEPVITTTLVEGAVRFGGVKLKPGQQAAIANDRIKVAEANIDQVLAWKNGLFSFEKADIYTVMRQLSRWYDVEVKFEGVPDNTPFQGEIGRSLTLAQVLKGLEQIHVHFRIEEDKRIVILP